jgi:CRP/FNR family transcriptional regulator, cyclic AMP receptor protein
MDQQGAIERLRSVPLFSEFGEKELQRVAAIVKEVSFPAGKVIAKQGETGVGFHMIVEGEATVSVDGVDHATLGPGSYSGEISLIDGGPRSATVTAKTDLNTVSLTSWDFNALLEEFPELSRTLLKQLCRRLRDVEQSISH